MSVFSKIKSYSDEAPASGFINVNFGKLTVTPVVVSWKNEGTVRSVIKRELKEGEELKNGEQLELKITVAISELNPKLTFEYERNVPIKSNGSQKADWAEITLPSLEKVFGKNWADAIEKNPYVAVEDASNIAGRASATGKVYGIPKFTATFKNKAECEAARDARYGKRDDEAAEEDEINPSAPTPEAIKQAASLIASIGEKKARKTLANHPFGPYDVDVLVALALNPDEDDE